MIHKLIRRSLVHFAIWDLFFLMVSLVFLFSILLISNAIKTVLYIETFLPETTLKYMVENYIISPVSFAKAVFGMPLLFQFSNYHLWELKIFFIIWTEFLIDVSFPSECFMLISPENESLIVWNESLRPLIFWHQKTHLSIITW